MIICLLSSNATRPERRDKGLSINKNSFFMYSLSLKACLSTENTF